MSKALVNHIAPSWLVSWPADDCQVSAAAVEPGVGPGIVVRPHITRGLARRTKARLPATPGSTFVLALSVSFLANDRLLGGFGAEGRTWLLIRSAAVAVIAWGLVALWRLGAERRQEGPS